MGGPSMWVTCESCIENAHAAAMPVMAAAI